MRARTDRQLRRIVERRALAWRRIAAQLEALRAATAPPPPPPAVQVDIPPHIMAAVEENWRTWFGDGDVQPTLTVAPGAPALPTPPCPPRVARPTRPQPALIDLRTAVSSVEARAESWRKG